MKLPFPNSPKRIAIFGLPGSGKSTFAMKLHCQLDLPVYHLDKHFFVENWVERDYKEFLYIQRNLVAEDKWIIDGCSMKSLELRWARADLMIYFKRPRLFCLWGLFKRFWQKEPAIDDRAPGCKESITWKLFTYMWCMDRRYACRLNELRTLFPDVSFVTVSSRLDAQRILNRYLKKPCD